jgi:protein NRD1
MSSAVADLDGYLQSMLGLKPPGVSGSKINSITQLCTANVQVRPSVKTGNDLT